MPPLAGVDTMINEKMNFAVSVKVWPNGATENQKEEIMSTIRHMTRTSRKPKGGNPCVSSSTL
jgi:hypothetical protein